MIPGHLARYLRSEHRSGAATLRVARDAARVRTARHELLIINDRGEIDAGTSSLPVPSSRPVEKLVAAERTAGGIIAKTRAEKRIRRGMRLSAWEIAARATRAARKKSLGRSGFRKIRITRLQHRRTTLLLER
jgi:hypothetical protein